MYFCLFLALVVLLNTCHGAAVVFLVEKFPNSEMQIKKSTVSSERSCFLSSAVTVIIHM